MIMTTVEKSEHKLDEEDFEKLQFLHSHIQELVELADIFEILAAPTKYFEVYSILSVTSFSRRALRLLSTKLLPLY